MSTTLLFSDGAAFVGALSNAKPTDIFSPGWPLNPDIASMPAVRIGLAFEPSEVGQMAISNCIDSLTLLRHSCPR